MTDTISATQEWRQGPPPADGNFWVVLDHLNNVDVVVSFDGISSVIERSRKPWAAYSAPETLAHLHPCIPHLENVQVKLKVKPTEVTP